MKTRRTRIWRIVLTALVALVLFLALLIGALLVFKPSALTSILSSDKITEADIDAEIERLQSQSPELFTSSYGGVSASELRSRIADSIRDRNLLVAEAKRRGITDASDAAQTSFDALRSGYVADDFSNYLKDKGISEAQLKASLEQNLIVAKLAKRLVGKDDISENEARAYFEANKDRYVSHASKRVSHILFEPGNMKTAQAVLRQIRSGGDFAALAAQYSKDGGSATRGGDIGWSTSTYPKTFQKAVDGLKTGQVSDPVTTKFGIHLIKVTDTKGAKDSLEDVREQVVSDLLAKRRGEAIEKLLAVLRAGG